MLYEAYFENVIELFEVKQLESDQSDEFEAHGQMQAPPTALEFLNILDRIRGGDGTEEAWVLVSRVGSRDTMGEAMWNKHFGKDEEITYLFTTNSKVDAHNAKMITRLNRPIALIEAEHTGNSKGTSSSAFMGLHCFLFLAVFAKVVMTSNVCQPARPEMSSSSNPSLREKHKEKEKKICPFHPSCQQVLRRGLVHCCLFPMPARQMLCPTLHGTRLCSLHRQIQHCYEKEEMASPNLEDHNRLDGIRCILHSFHNDGPERSSDSILTHSQD
jgi:hypothetical protein